MRCSCTGLRILCKIPMETVVCRSGTQGMDSESGYLGQISAACHPKVANIVKTGPVI